MLSDGRALLLQVLLLPPPILPLSPFIHCQGEEGEKKNNDFVSSNHGTDVLRAPNLEAFLLGVEMVLRLENGAWSTFK